MPFCWAAAADEPIIRIFKTMTSPEQSGWCLSWVLCHRLPIFPSTAGSFVTFFLCTALFSVQQTFCLHAIYLKMGPSYSINLKYLPSNSLTYDNYVRTDTNKIYNWRILIPNVTRCHISWVSNLAYKIDLSKGSPQWQNTQTSLDSIFML